jgi:hypothetical protein
MITIEVKRTIGQTEIKLGKAVANKEDVQNELKELYDLVEVAQKELFPAKTKELPRFVPGVAATKDLY